MSYNDATRSYIELLIENKNWTAAHAALVAYIAKYGEDYWAKNMMALVEANL